MKILVIMQSPHFFMHKIYEDFKLIFIGDGPELVNIKKQVFRFGLQSKVIFKGWLSKEEVSSYLNKCQFLVVPSMWPEPFGIVGLEAMSHNKPVIAFDAGGISDWLIHNYNGLLIERGNIIALSKAIKLLLNSPDLCRKLGQNGYNKVQESFSAQNHVNRLLSIFEKVIKNRSSGVQK